MESLRRLKVLSQINHSAAWKCTERSMIVTHMRSVSLLSLLQLFNLYTPYQFNLFFNRLSISDSNIAAMPLKISYSSPCSIYSIMKTLVMYPIKSSFYCIKKVLPEVLPEVPQVMIDMHSRRTSLATFVHIRNDRKVASVIDGSERRIVNKRRAWRAANLGPGEVLCTSPLRHCSSQDCR